MVRLLREKGIGAEIKHAPVISLEEKQQLWESGAISIQSLLVLVKAVFFNV